MDIPWRMVGIGAAVVSVLVIIATAVLVYAVPDGVVTVRNFIPIIAGVCGVGGIGIIGYSWWRSRDSYW